MSKQSEIKGILKRKIELGVSFGYTSEEITNEVWEFLHNSGVVIKVKKKPELNFPKQFYKMDDSMYYETIAVEPLIEEE